MDWKINIDTLVHWYYIICMVLGCSVVLAWVIWVMASLGDIEPKNFYLFALGILLAPGVMYLIYSGFERTRQNDITRGADNLGWEYEVQDRKHNTATATDAGGEPARGEGRGREVKTPTISMLC